MKKISLVLAALISSPAYAVDEITVYGEQTTLNFADPIQQSTVIESVDPTYTYNSGGTGGFTGWQNSGAQNIHTQVYRNGVPANEAGSGWYDFAHDIATGQSVKVISGSNSVIYGSGSMAGTVLIDEIITPNTTVRLGSDEKFIVVAPTDNIQISHLDLTQDSVRNDNDEKDDYTNTTGSVDFTVAGLNVLGSYTDYEYDYDQCYTAFWTTSNDCVQKGERFNVSISNDYFVVGKSVTETKYYTANDMTYKNKNTRDFARLYNTSMVGPVEVTYGVDGNREKYGSETERNYGTFVSANYSGFNVGVRAGNDDQDAVRVGYERGLFFANAGTSYRKPNLYERFGDSWVSANPNLKPEEGVGYEVGYDGITLFRYDFDETISYDMMNAIYYNSGDYTTEGVKIRETFGNFYTVIKYINTEQPRVPEKSITLGYENKGFSVSYTGNFDRAPSAYDGDSLNDIEKVDVSYEIQSGNQRVAFSVENVLDDVDEFVPGYDTSGRNITLTVQALF